MKHLFPALALILSFGAGQAMAENRVVTFQNLSGQAIEALFGSNTGTNDWEEDLLGDGTLGIDEEIDVNFDDGTGSCAFDFKAVYGDGSEGVLPNVDVCSIASVTIE